MIDFDQAIKMSEIPDSPQLLEVASICSNFKGRPSEFQGIKDPEEALAYDFAAMRIMEERERQTRQQDAVKLGTMIGENVRKVYGEIYNRMKADLVAEINNRDALYRKIKEIIQNESV